MCSCVGLYRVNIDFSIFNDEISSNNFNSLPKEIEELSIKPFSADFWCKTEMFEM